MRVATLLPSATEIVTALGVEPVAVSHECDYPPSVTEKPAVTRSRIDPSGTSAEIDEAVLRTERDRGGVYDIDLDVLREADPDVVVTQGICDVCAVDSVLVEKAVDRLGLDATIVTTDPHRLDDTFDDIRRIGAALGQEAEADELVRSLRTRVRAVDRSTNRVRSRPRTVILDWLDPVMVAGHWIPELVRIAGGRYELADPGDPSRPWEWDDVRASDPEVLILSPCGFELEQIRSNLVDVTTRTGWHSITAVERDRVFLLDGHHYVNRPGPRLVDTVEYLSGILHPESVPHPPDDVARSLGSLPRI